MLFVLKRLAQILLPVLLIYGALEGAKYLKSKKEAPRSKKEKKLTPSAEVVAASPGTYAPPLASFGTVTSYDETSLGAQVVGEIVEVAPEFRVGLRVRAGDVLVRLSDVTYRAELETAKANVIIAESSLQEEAVEGKQAAEDWLASGRDLASASPFVLRKPQLESAKASLASAQAVVTQALQDLANTVIRAPYDGLVLARGVSLGDLANGNTVLGRIIATSKAEVRLPLTADQLAQWKQSSKQEVILKNPAVPSSQWQGVVRRSDPTLDAQNQVTFLIAEIEHPYDGEHPLAVGSFVNALLPTPDLVDVYRVGESALVNDAYLWIVTAENTLHKLMVQRLRSYEGSVYLRVESSEIEPPLQIATLPLTTFREGQKVEPVEK